MTDTDSQQCIWCGDVVAATDVVQFNYQGGWVYLCKKCAVNVTPHELKTKLRQKAAAARR